MPRNLLTALPCRLACALAGLLTAMPCAAATDVAALRLQSLAGSCAACHGTEGRAVDGSSIPGLAGQPAAVLNAQLLAFKSGAAPATVMHQLARGFSDAQLASLAAYFAARRP